MIINRIFEFEGERIMLKIQRYFDDTVFNVKPLCHCALENCAQFPDTLISEHDRSKIKAPIQVVTKIASLARGE